MNINRETGTSRRRFIKDGMRMLSLSGLVFGAAYFGWLRPGEADGQHKNAPQNPCRDCRQLSTCKEPQAVTFRTKQKTGVIEQTKAGDSECNGQER